MQRHLGRTKDKAPDQAWATPARGSRPGAEQPGGEQDEAWSPLATHAKDASDARNATGREKAHGLANH